MRAELRAVLDALLRLNETGGLLTLDAIGDAIGTLAVTQDEIEALLTALEERGLSVMEPEGRGAEQALELVVVAARELSNEGRRRPTVAEVAARAGLSAQQVREALALLRVMQR